MTVHPSNRDAMPTRLTTNLLDDYDWHHGVRGAP